VIYDSSSCKTKDMLDALLFDFIIVTTLVEINYYLRYDLQLLLYGPQM
jgi:hypothetical protein